MLPLFTAPMNSILDENNYQSFLKNKINTIIPRGICYDIRWRLSTKTFIALGLTEFKTFIRDFTIIFNTTDDIRYVCVDIANGHMKKLLDLCKEAKLAFGGRLLLMAGNIANPQTYTDYSMAGIDFVRVGIGGGSACITSANGGIHYAMASLIKDIVDVKWNIQKAIEESRVLRIDCKYQSLPLIIADGGFNSYDKIIKALALGADYVMIGKLFAQCEEACGEVIYGYNLNPRELTYNEHKKEYDSKYRYYYGMSTKKAQLETRNTELKTSEGIEIIIPILYTLNGWCENFIDYLRSMMSYTNALDLIEFKNSEYKIVSPSEYLAFYK
ncbi:MAG: IMP dehydrogenase [Bacilli bacterium]